MRARWERIGANGAVATIWSLTIDLVKPDILFAGVRLAAVYRSRDDRRHWEKAVDIARECSIGVPFVTSVIVDPDDHRIVWAGVEIDGVFRSQDGETQPPVAVDVELAVGELVGLGWIEAQDVVYLLGHHGDALGRGGARSGQYCGRRDGGG
jgi:hypothetical protein